MTSSVCKGFMRTISAVTRGFYANATQMVIVYLGLEEARSKFVDHLQHNKMNPAHPYSLQVGWNQTWPLM